MSEIFNLFSEKDLLFFPNGIGTIIINEEGIESLSSLIQYGRKNIQELVVRSNDIEVALAYIRFERNFEILKAMSFKTIDSISFEKKKSFLWNIDSKKV